MARGVKGSSKDKANIERLVNVVKETNFRGPAAGGSNRPALDTETGLPVDSKGLTYDKTLEEEGESGALPEVDSPVAGIEGGLGPNTGKEKLALSESAASEMTIEDSVMVKSSDFTYKFKKVSGGGSNTIVEILRSDGRETTQTFPNPARADDFIAGMQKRISDAKEAKEAQQALEDGYQPLSITRPYPDGIVKGADGELVITLKEDDSQLVVIVELAEAVTKFLAGRQVQNGHVHENGLTLITSSDFQKVTFRWDGEKALVIR